MFLTALMRPLSRIVARCCSILSLFLLSNRNVVTPKYLLWGKWHTYKRYALSKGRYCSWLSFQSEKQCRTGSCPCRSWWTHRLVLIHSFFLGSSSEESNQFRLLLNHHKITIGNISWHYLQIIPCSFHAIEVVILKNLRAHELFRIFLRQEQIPRSAHISNTQYLIVFSIWFTNTSHCVTQV